MAIVVAVLGATAPICTAIWKRLDDASSQRVKWLELAQDLHRTPEQRQQVLRFLAKSEDPQVHDWATEELDRVDKQIQAIAQLGARLDAADQRISALTQGRELDQGLIAELRSRLDRFAAPLVSSGVEAQGGTPSPASSAEPSEPRLIIAPGGMVRMIPAPDPSDFAHFLGLGSGTPCSAITGWNGEVIESDTAGGKVKTRVVDGRAVVDCEAGIVRAISLTLPVGDARAGLVSVEKSLHALGISEPELGWLGASREVIRDFFGDPMSNAGDDIGLVCYLGAKGSGVRGVVFWFDGDICNGVFVEFEKT